MLVRLPAEGLLKNGFLGLFSKGRFLSLGASWGRGRFRRGRGEGGRGFPRGERFSGAPERERWPRLSTEKESGFG